MAAIQKVWTSSADFNTGSFVSANAATAGEVRKDAGSVATGTWSAEYDAGLGSHPLWQALTLAFAVSGAGSTLDVYARSSAIPGDLSGTFQHVGEIVPGMGSTKTYGLSSAYGRRRYFQVFVILTPFPAATVANVRLLSVQLDGQTTSPAAPIDPLPLEGERGIAGAKSGFASQAGPRAAHASAAGARAGFARGLA